MVVRGAERRARAAVISRAITTFMPWENYKKRKRQSGAECVLATKDT